MTTTIRGDLALQLNLFARQGSLSSSGGPDEPSSRTSPRLSSSSRGSGAVGAVDGPTADGGEVELGHGDGSS
jgi:hypothetical protein